MSPRVSRLAARAPVPIFVAAGHGAAPDVARLRGSEELRLVATPRQAVVMVVAGHHPDDRADALRQVHDQLPEPRTTAVLGNARMPAALRDPVPLGDEHPEVRLAGLGRDLLTRGGSERPLGPAENPVDWQGIGPHGQGGEGMMGGRPYGRSMAMTDEGRDGLALDRLPLTLGPYLPALPPGLRLEVGLQGDVLEEVTLHLDPAPAAVSDRTPAERAGVLLAHLAELVALAGLPALARRTARIAVSPQPADVRALRGRLDRWWGLRAATDGVGRIEVDGLPGGDATDRWRRWFDDAARLLGADADDAGREASGPAPAGALGDALVGMELGRAVLTLASLRPEFERAGRAAPA